MKKKILSKTLFLPSFNHIPLVNGNKNQSGMKKDFFDIGFQKFSFTYLHHWYGIFQL